MKTFKYRAIGHWDGNKINPCPYTQNMFVNRELWFSYPNSFNDPFDCNLPLNIDGATNKDVEDYYKKGASEENYKHNMPQNFDPESLWENNGCFKEAFDNLRNKIYNQSSCYCWSTNEKSIPMFAYYADGHKGLCAEFKFPDNHEAVKDAFKIECIPNFPELNFLTLVKGTKEQLVKSLIATKANCWEHEGEYRVFRENTREGNVKYDDSCLKRIILGAKATKEYEMAVRNWLSDWKAKVQLARAKPSDKEFKLIIEDIGSIGGK